MVCQAVHDISIIPQPIMIVDARCEVCDLDRLMVSFDSHLLLSYQKDSCRVKMVRMESEKASLREPLMVMLQLNSFVVLMMILDDADRS